MPIRTSGNIIKPDALIGLKLSATINSANTTVRKPPAITKSPCAKFTAPIALMTKTNPRVIKA